jgi:SAM-dependent methyltransferase
MDKTNIEGICDSQAIVPKARGVIHQVIIEWFSAQPRGKLLDAPAGYGHLSLKLKELGFQVTGGEIEPEIFKANEVECIFTDLNRRIEARDNYFDYVCCVDGLEHMTDPYKAVEEFSRVLKNGGIGVFSIPNYSNIETRFQFFLRGSLTKPKSREDYVASGKNLYNFHNSPLTITLLNLIFEINNLAVIDILRDKIKHKQYFFFPVVMMMKAAAACSSKESYRKNRYDLTLHNKVIFGGNTLIIIVKKNVS